MDAESVSLNVMITFDEIYKNKRFSPDKITKSIENIGYKFDIIYFVLDTYVNSTLTECKKDECLTTIKSTLETLKDKWAVSVEYYIIDYENTDMYNKMLEEYVKDPKALLNRGKYYKNTLIYIISTLICKTRYMFHLDGNREIFKTNNENSLNFVEKSLECLQNNNDIVGTCVPRKNMELRIIMHNEYFDFFKSHFVRGKYHLSLQAYLVDVQRYKDVVLGHFKKDVKNYNKHIENLIDSSFSKKFPLFMKMSISNIYKDS